MIVEWMHKSDERNRREDGVSGRWPGSSVDHAREPLSPVRPDLPRDCHAYPSSCNGATTRRSLRLRSHFSVTATASRKEVQSRRHRPLADPLTIVGVPHPREVAVLRLSGTLDHVSAPETRTQLVAAIETGSPTLIVDALHAPSVNRSTQPFSGAPMLPSLAATLMG